MNRMYMSGGETEKVRDRVLPFLKGKCNGLDIGYGGDPITPSVICMDVNTRYTNVGNFPQQLTGSATNLYWFKDGVLDYVYSSHLLEDYSDPRPLLQEWLRVLVVGGLLILYLPDEKKYRAKCQALGESPNCNHHNDEMGLKWMKTFLNAEFPSVELIYEFEELGYLEYSFLLVLRKRGMPNVGV